MTSLDGRAARVAEVLLAQAELADAAGDATAAADLSAVAAALARLRPGDAATAARHLSAQACRAIIRAAAERATPLERRTNERAALRADRAAALLYAIAGAPREAVAEPVQPALALLKACPPP